MADCPAGDGSDQGPKTGKFKHKSICLIYCCQACVGCLKRHMQVFRAGLAVAVVLRPRQPSSISRRALLCSLPSVRARVCTPRFALGAQRPTTYLPPNWLPHFSTPSFTFCLPKYLISSSVECGSFREKSEGIINQGSHRRRHVTLGWGPDCHQPV